MSIARRGIVVVIGLLVLSACSARPLLNKPPGIGKALQSAKKFSVLLDGKTGRVLVGGSFGQVCFVGPESLTVGPASLYLARSPLDLPQDAVALIYGPGSVIEVSPPSFPTNTAGLPSQLFTGMTCAIKTLPASAIHDIDEHPRGYYLVYRDGRDVASSVLQPS
jgi:hypothetical protein